MNWPSALADPRALFRTASQQVRTVELIEDDPSMQRALSMALRESGVLVDVYGSRRDYVNAPRPAGLRVVLLDMRLPDCSGLEIYEWLHSRSDQAPVIFLSGQSAPQEIIDAMKRGAHDFLLKPVRLARLLEAVERAFELQQETLDGQNRKDRLLQKWLGLTPREREVCALMLKGMSNREIARLHGSMPGTVKVHRARVLEKMSVRTLSDLFDLAAGVNLEALTVTGKDAG